MDDCLIACKSAAEVTMFKKELLTRFIGTDEGEVTQYLGCELIRDRQENSAELVQAGYAERVLKTFGMWDCKPVVNITRPDLAFACSQLSKFVQYPGIVHLEAAERVLQ